MSKATKRDFALAEALLDDLDNEAGAQINQVIAVAGLLRAEREHLLNEVERLAGENYGPSVLAAIREIRTCGALGNREELSK